jgi:hypothetical protein
MMGFIFFLDFVWKSLKKNQNVVKHEQSIGLHS